MAQHPGPAFEREKEAAARKRFKDLNANPKLLGDKAEPAAANDLDAIGEEAAFHLGNVYYAQARLKAGVRDDKAHDALVEIERLSRARHDELLALAGKEIERQTRKK